MTDTAPSRSAAIAAEYEVVQQAFTRLVESLSDEQWSRRGVNFPERMNDEDEGRTVGVIAHHVAVSASFIMGRIQAVLEGRQLDPVDIRALNAAHAGENSRITREEVVALLRKSGPEIAEAVRAIPDEKLPLTIETPFGPMSVEQRLERVLVGHLKGHQAVIQATIA